MSQRKRPVTEEAASVPISSMIDIVFLLIIFFIVTATLDKEAQDAEVLLADAPNGRPEEKHDPRTITINIHKDGDLFVGGRQVTPAEITSLLESAKKASPNDPLSIPIVIRGDRRVQYGHASDLMDAITKTGLYKVSLTGLLE